MAAKSPEVLAARELAHLRQQNSRLRTDADNYRKLKRSIQRPTTEKSVVVAQPFQLVDPRRKPQTGSKVLPPMGPPLVLGKQMGSAIVTELRAMTIDTRALLRTLARGPNAKEQLSQAMDAPPDGSTASGIAQQRIDALKDRYRQRFATLADDWSRRMIASVVSQSSAQLNIGLKDMAERLEIQSTLQAPRLRAVVEASTQASVGLITRIPERFLGSVQTAVMSAITTGTGLDQLVPYLTKKYKGDARHARLTALDQIRKVSESVNATRLQSLGVEEYVWIHTGGERYPRKLHESYSGRTFRYDDPPIIDARTGERGKPGDAINCRCRMRAVLNFRKMREVA